MSILLGAEAMGLLLGAAEEVLLGAEAVGLRQGEAVNILLGAEMAGLLLGAAEEVLPGAAMAGLILSWPGTISASTSPHGTSRRNFLSWPPGTTLAALIQSFWCPVSLRLSQR